MRKKLLVAITFALSVILLLPYLSVSVDGFYTDTQFSSPEIQLLGTEVVNGDIRLRISPGVFENRPAVVLPTVGGDNWVPLENIDSWADWDGKAVVGVKDRHGRAYVYALWRSASDSDRFRRYDFTAGSWQSLGGPTDSGLPVVKNGACMAWDGGIYIYVMRGAAYGDFLRDFWRYNIETESWEVLESTPWYQGAGNTMVWVKLGENEYIYAVIGTTSSSASSGRRGMVLARFNIRAWETDPDNDPSKWEVLQWVPGYSSSGVPGRIPYGCDDGSTLVWTGENYLYYLVGAYNEHLPGPEESRFLRYHLLEGRWEELAPIPYNGLPEDRSGVDDGGCLVWPGGEYIYAVKGGDSGGSIYADNFYRYNIRTNAWEKLRHLPEGVGKRSGSRIAAVDGKVYFLRGQGSTGFWRYEPPKFTDSHTILSSVFDAGVEAEWGKISWLAGAPAGALSRRISVSDEPLVLPGGVARVGLQQVWTPAGHLVISEFATRGPDNAYQEFIELYNPTSSDVDLSGWKVQYRSATGTTWYDRVAFPSGAVITANGFYLMVNESGYPGGVIDGVQADATFSSAIADSGHLRIVDSSGRVIDAVSYGTGHNYTEEGQPAPNHGTSANNRSVERKALPTSTAADMSAGGAHENLGNACDTENNGFDFVVRSARNPQNSSGLSEAPPAPLPLRTYLQTVSADNVFEDISEEAVGFQQQTIPENQQLTEILQGENLNSPDLMNDDDGIYFEVNSEELQTIAENWVSMASWPGLLGNAAACYAENRLSGKKYVYAHDTRNLYRYDIGVALWENMGPLPASATAGSGMVWTGGDYIYITRGGSYTPNFWRYSVPDNSWATLASTPTTQLSGSSLAWGGGDNIYGVFRGDDNGLYVYSISSNTWTKLFSMLSGSIPPGPASGSSLVALGGSLYYAVGGSSAYWRYRTSDNTWEVLASAPASWGAGGAQEVVNENYIYAVRGGTTASFYRFVVRENRWETMVSLPATVSNANDRLAFDGTYLYMLRAYGDSSFWRYPQVIQTFAMSVESSVQFNLPAGHSLDRISVLLNFSSENAGTYYLGIYDWTAGQYLENSLEHSGNTTVENTLVVSVSDNKYISSDNRVRVRIRSSASSSHRLLADRLLIEFHTTRKAYALRWGYVLEGLDNRCENVRLVIAGYSVPADENVRISVWREKSSSWVDLAVLSASPSWVTLNLPNIGDYLVGGESLLVKFEDEDNTDAVGTTMMIDFIGVEASKPYATSVAVAVRLGSDSNPNDEPSPPENWTDWIAITSGQQLARRYRYFQYRIELTSSVGEVSPFLSDLIVEFYPMVEREGIFVSQPILLGYVDDWGELTWEAEIPPGTSVEFATRSSADGFLWSDWAPPESGKITSPVFNRRYLQVMATLRGFGMLSPVLRSFSVKYTPDRTPPQIVLIEPRDGFRTHQDRILVKGHVGDSNPVRVEVNGIPVLFKPGEFETTVKLSPGPNIVRVTASDASGNKRELVIRGTMEPQQAVQPAAPAPTSAYAIAAITIGVFVAGVSLASILLGFPRIRILPWIFLLSLLLFFPLVSVAAPDLPPAQTIWMGSWISEFREFQLGEFENTEVFTSGELALSPARYWGNDFAASYYYTEWTNLDSPEKKVSIRFVAQSSKTLKDLQVYLYQTGQDLTWRFRLEIDDGSGRPSGVLAWPDAWQTVKVTSSKWWTITLLSPGLLRKGEIYHIVISWENMGSPPSSQDFINIRSLWPFNPAWINGITTNENRGVLIFDGSWMDLGREPVYILGFSDKTYEGNPYYTLRTDTSEIGIFLDNAKGEMFQVDRFIRVSGVKVYARRSGIPADNLYMILFRGVYRVAEAVVGTPSTVDNMWSWVGAIFDAPVTLSPGQYTLGLLSPLSTSWNRYDINVLGTYSSSPHPELTFCGTSARFSYSVTGGITWATKSKMQDDVPFKFIEAFNTSGSFNSRVFDAGEVMRWERLEWEGKLPSGTAISIQTRSSRDNVNWSPWEDVENDGLIKSPPGRYLQYRIFLSSRSESVSPTVRKVAVFFSDSTPPRLISFFPTGGQTVQSRRPTIEVIFDDLSGIDTGSIVVRLDGKEIAFSYDAITKTLTYSPVTDLSLGSHEIYVSVRDMAGNQLEERWSFIAEVEKKPNFSVIIPVLVIVVIFIAFVLKMRR